MKGIGKMICNMDLEYKFIVMATNTRECLSKAAEMEKEPITIQRAKFIKEVGLMVELKGLEFALGLIIKDMKGSGLITKSTGMEYIPGLTADLTKEIIVMIRNSDMGRILGQMGESILDNGKMIKGMGEEHM